MPANRTPRCPKCESATVWTRSTPASNGLVGHLYECSASTFLYTVVEADPLTKAEGWLNGELKPPVS